MESFVQSLLQLKAFRKDLAMGSLVGQDHWVLDLPLYWKPSFFGDFLLEANVSVFLDDGVWNYDLLLEFFGIVESVISIPISCSRPGDDKWVWGPSPSGKAKPNSVYRFSF